MHKKNVAFQNSIPFQHDSDKFFKLLLGYSLFLRQNYVRNNQLPSLRARDYFERFYPTSGFKPVYVYLFKLPKQPYKQYRLIISLWSNFLYWFNKNLQSYLCFLIDSKYL